MIGLNGHGEVPEKQFTGYWIPAAVVDLFEKEEINAKEMILLALIDSLSKSGKGCFASNEYLSDRLQLSPDKVSNAITKLKDTGLVVQTGFDGRRRFLKTVWTEGLENRSETRRNRRGRPAETVEADPPKPAGIYNKSNNIELRSKINLRTKGGRKSATVRPNAFFTSEFDREAAALLRGILVEHDSDLVAPPRHTRVDTFAKHIARLRIDRGVEEEEIRDMLQWLERRYGESFIPMVRKSDDLYTQWSKFCDAKKRDERDPDGEASESCRKSSGHKRKMLLREKVIKYCLEEGTLNDDYEPVHPGAVKHALKALGEKPDALSANFINTVGREE